MMIIAEVGGDAARSRGMWAASKCWKRKGSISLRSPEETPGILQISFQICNIHNFKNKSVQPEASGIM